MSAAIGTVRAEEAKVFDSEAGYHQFHDESGQAYGSFEVFWSDGEVVEEDAEVYPVGWYWQACLPGCLPDGEPIGPFSSSIRAFYDADENAE